MAKNILPIFEWGKNYNKSFLSSDLTAAVIVTIMLIPQSMAYALLAGLPPQIGLYASILPLIAYAAFGTSRALAVGPVAVISLMTAAAIGKLSGLEPSEYLIAASTLALLSGLFLVILGIFRLGFITNFLSHPVIAGFITAAGLIIAATQLKHILGIKASGQNLLELLTSLISGIGSTNWITFSIGVFAIGFLLWVRRELKPTLLRLGTSNELAEFASKIGPALVVILTILPVWALGLREQGVLVVEDIPIGLPSLSLQGFSAELWISLISSAMLISLVGFVESISVAQTLAAKERNRINPNQELIGLGAANIASGISGAYPVTGGFARSIINYDAGAKTPAAGAFTALGIALSTLTLTPALYYLPKATLAAIIIVAIISLIDFNILRHTWQYSRRDFIAALATIIITLILGVEIGITVGIALSIFLFLHKTSSPHIAVVGLIPGTEHFRNRERNEVETHDEILCARVDQSLYFTNARYLEDYLTDKVKADNNIKHIILVCSSINEIDATALSALESVNETLMRNGVQFHLSEVKSTILDKLNRTSFPDDLSGEIFSTQFSAYTNLCEKCDCSEREEKEKQHTKS